MRGEREGGKRLWQRRIPATKSMKQHCRANENLYDLKGEAEKWRLAISGEKRSDSYGGRREKGASRTILIPTLFDVYA